ncbi:MAG: 4-(cytidine 5'-diphospho)-2-C-methyl-D-erythritol kinase [Phycisphaerales bacterium]|nr:4-(cytidine 5'-diphospho)-2-C-methyl-D-erythritol kinase [Phycisphaerales bacterium]
MAAASQITVACPAKLNLALAVGAPLANGMHRIASWMITLSWGDELQLQRLPPLSLSAFAIQWATNAPRPTEIDWPISRDLAFRAHQVLEAHVKHPLPVRMRLDKRIPVGGGLGGGSSNAAAMLRGLNQLFDLGLTASDLAPIAAGLGSDVSFLVRGGSSIVRGLGESVLHLDATPEIHVVLAFPAATCSTGSVYRMFDELLPQTPRSELPRREAEVLALAQAGALDPHLPFNDLAVAAARVSPQMAASAVALGKLSGKPIHVCGSGSSLFCLCASNAEASLLASRAHSEIGLPAVACGTCPSVD